MAAFLSTVSSLDWDSCRTVIDTHIPGGAAQAMQDADTVFGGYLPALTGWEFGPQQAATISQPVLSLVGTDTQQLFADSHALLHTWIPHVEDRVIEGVGHLLHLQRPEPVMQGEVVAGAADVAAR